MKLVVIGDSIVKGTYTAPQDFCPSSVAKPDFSELLADALRCDLVNHGVNGVSYSSLSSVKGELSLSEQCEKFETGDVILICAGTNDYGTNVPLGEYSDERDISFYGAADIVFRTIKERNPSASIYAVTPLPRANEEKNAAGYTLKDYRKAIIKKAEKYGLVSIDGEKYPVNVHDDRQREKYMFDGVHPTLFGHRVYAQHILRAMRGEPLKAITAEELISRCQNAENGDKIILPENCTIDVWTDDCLRVFGYHCSNTASFEENPEGERPVALFLKGKKNVVIDGNNSKIVVHGISTPFVFDRCENVTLKNLTIDYARPTMSEFTILSSVSEGEYLIECAKDSFFDIDGDRLIWRGEKRADGEYFWSHDYRDARCISMFKDPFTDRTQMMDSDSTHKMPCVGEFAKIERVDGRKLKVLLKDKKAFFPVGATIQSRLTLREQLGGFFERCKNVRMENVTIRAMHGLGILAQFCDNVTYKNVKILPKEGRTIASNADFFQVSGCRGRLVFENCRLAGGHDDFINVHGTYLQIVKKRGAKLLLRFKNPYSRGFQAVETGDVLDFVNRNTLIPYASATVKTFKKISDNEIEVVTEEEIAAETGDYAENATWTPELLIRNNFFGPSMSRGVLCATRRKTRIENNVFYRLGGSALYIEDDCNFWFESGYTADVAFKNNAVIESGYGYSRGRNVPIIQVNPQVMDKESEECVHKKLVIEGNRFINLPCGAYAIDVKYTQNLRIENNVSHCPLKIKTHRVENLIEKGNIYGS